MLDSKRALIDRLQCAIERIECEESADFADSVFEGRENRLLDAPQEIGTSDCIDDENVVDGTKKSRADEAFSRIVKLANYKERSSHGVSKRLSEEGYAEDDVALALAKAKRYRIIDDTRYADMLVRARYNQGRGRCRVERDLAAEGISAASVPAFAELFEDDNEVQVQRAVEFLRRRPSRSKNPFPSSCKKLISHGFEYETAVAATKIWMSEINIK